MKNVSLGLVETINQSLKNAGIMVLPNCTDENLEDYGLDSLVRAMAIIELERAFNIHISPNDLDKIKLNSVDDFLALLKLKGVN